MFWYLRRCLIITKNNLVKRNWHESTNCVFFPQEKTLKYLFFECRFACSIWSVIQIVSNLYPPNSVANVFGNWLHEIDKKFRTVIRVGAIAVIWSLWLSRNDNVFNDKYISHMQVLYRCTSILRTWSTLQRVGHETSLRRRVHGWNRWQGTFYHNMGGRLIVELVLHRLLSLSWHRRVTPFWWL